MAKADEKNIDLLQNIEFGIVEIYRSDASLIDIDAKDAIDALVRHYHAEEEQRTPPVRRLGARAQRVFDSVQELCEWRLGRITDPEDDDPGSAAVPVAELVEALRKIQKSIPRWSEQGGRKGYLDFVSEHIR